MPRAVFRSIIPKLLPPKVFQDAFEKSAREMEKDVKGSFNDAVATWKNKPDFRGYVRIAAESIYISVGTTDKVFKFVDQGTKAHFIRPVRAKVLHWIDPASGEDRFSKGHQVSGIKPREITKSINEIWRGGLMADYFDRHLMQAIQESGHAI
jgi:hypothetical protein